MTGSPYAGIGRPATGDEIAAWDIDVRPDFKGLPPGSGSVATGQKIWDAKCASCHGTFGESNEVFAPLVGGTTAADIKAGHVKSLTSPDTARTTLMKLANMSTLWDYVHRAMPWNAPKSLGNDEVYAVVAYLLNLGDILPDDFVLSDRNIAEVQSRLPNRSGLVPDPGLWNVKGMADTANTACMKDCAAEVRLASVFPEWAKDSHGDLAQQNRSLRTASASSAAKDSGQELAKAKGCLACHGIDRKLLGPSLQDVATKYRGDASAPARLEQKIRAGGVGTWGSIPMPAHPGLAANDAAALVRWVLGL
jgi:cytochrome c